MNVCRTPGKPVTQPRHALSGPHDKGLHTLIGENDDWKKLEIDGTTCLASG